MGVVDGGATKYKKCRKLRAVKFVRSTVLAVATV